MRTLFSMCAAVLAMAGLLVAPAGVAEATMMHHHRGPVKIVRVAAPAPMVHLRHHHRHHHHHHRHHHHMHHHMHHHAMPPKPVVVVTPGKPCKCGTYKYYSKKHHGCLDARLKK